MLERFKDRPLSHSQLSSFEYNPDEWYKSYILRQRTPPTPEMLAGNRIGDAIGTDKNPIPNLNPPGIKEYEMKIEWEGLHLIGYADHFCPDMIELHENKTSPNKKRWTPKKVNEHKQLTMYAMLLNIKLGIEPEDITMFLNFIPTSIVGINYQPLPNWRQFETRRTKEHVEAYKVYIIDTLKAMNDYIEKRALSTPDRSAPSFNNI